MLFRKLNINSYVINKLFKLQVFCSLKLCIRYKLIDHIINNIRLIQKREPLHIKGAFV